MPPFICKTLCRAFETFIRINQINGRDVNNSYKQLSLRVNACIGEEDVKGILQTMARQLLNSTAVNLQAKKETPQEDRRILWTTFHNLSMWFDSWESNLLLLGFAERDINGTVTISDSQLKRILNIDETCLSFDGSNGCRGGCPSATFYDPNLPSI